MVLPVDDLAKRLDDQLIDMKDKVRINGFRPGKVPMAHLKKAFATQPLLREWKADWLESLRLLGE